jgi:uncharacterized protein YbjT (DUF2867 family)
MRVLVAGSTGLVGSACVAELLREKEVTRVVALVRRSWPEAPGDPRLEVALLDFDGLPRTFPPGESFDAVICALGTTMRQAGTESGFRRVDFSYTVALGRAARDHNVPHLLLVSALGASRASRILYNRVKGETEDAVRALGFPRVTIARPSLLLGDRKEVRAGEMLGKVFGYIAPPRWRPVHASAVARALVRAALSSEAGVRVLENSEIRRAGR